MPLLETFIVHGEPQAAQTMARKIYKLLGWDVVVPEFKQSFELN